MNNITTTDWNPAQATWRSQQDSDILTLYYINSNHMYYVNLLEYLSTEYGWVRVKEWTFSSKSTMVFSCFNL